MKNEKTIGLLNKSHVPKLEELLNIYKSASTYDDVCAHQIQAGLCLSIREHVGVETYYSDEFNLFIGNTQMYLCDTPKWCMEKFLNFNEAYLISIKPRIEALEKIINYLNN